MRGKVREMYDLGDVFLMVATDRLSAFDVIMPEGIPDKGKVLTQLSAFWFQHLADYCPHHLISTKDEDIQSLVGAGAEDIFGRATIVRKAPTIPIECVARGYLAGSWWKDYAGGDRAIHGVNLPDGLLESSRLPEPVFTPATKAASGHDENISFEQAANLIGKEMAITLQEWTITLYVKAAEFAATKGLILADTKFEFGMTSEGPIWIDEALTPDSSRYWDAALYQEGQSQASYDKQFIRDYLETLDWDKTAPGPHLPEDVISRTRAKYLEAFQRITGCTLNG
jgi:phosphoribosylaminoimidazole-succinocarboxamide synthase